MIITATARTAAATRPVFLVIFFVLAGWTTTVHALNILVVGGSGRVGGSTVRWLEEYGSRGILEDVQLAVGCRTQASFDKAKQKGVLPKSVQRFVALDLNVPENNNNNNNNNSKDDSIASAIQGFDLVVHTAGPFQGRTDPTLLRACVQQKIPYVDVCDEYELAVTSKKELMDLAQKAKVPAVVCGGIWPGMSALMAAEAKAKLEAQTGEKCDTLDLSFFTAGTGNAGPTIVSATFLLLATPALVFMNGLAAKKEPWTEPRTVDFGPGVGNKPIWLLDNPDVPTTATTLGVPNVSSRFGTDPLPWNYLFGAMKAIPRPLLYNREAMQAFALFSEPIIRFVDRLVGATNAMRVDAKTADGKHVVTSRIVHPDLEVCVGLATAAFCVEVLKGTIAPGIWYPAELSQEARTNLLEAVKEDTISYMV